MIKMYCVLCFALQAAAWSPIQKYAGLDLFKDREPLEIITQFLPEDPVILEAGAHYGTDTVKFAKLWPKASIHSFEPNPHAFALLNEATCNLRQVSTYNIALNNYNGNAVFHICYGTNGNDPIFEGASSLLDAAECQKIHYRGPDITVPCVVLDDWCANHGIDHIDFMWLDLEGVELQVLQSSPKILSSVRVIFTETSFFEFRKGMTQYDQLKHFLEQSGFKLIAHSYAEGLQGDAIFIRKEPFEN